MAVSRRRFVQAATIASAAVAAAPHIDFEHAYANAVSAAPTVVVPPPPEVIALNRIAYGPRPGDIARVKQIGLDAYIAEQLNPGAIDDSACEQRLAATQLKVRYDLVNELRPIAPTLAKKTTDLWAELIVTEKPFGEYTLPWQMVRIATYIRAVYSKRQLNEVLVDFWHNHFNVRPGSEREVSVGFPEHDQIIRQHALGNFRQFVEAIGRNAAMLFDLDNASNIAGPGEAGNENYARELFELQTLGSDNYSKFETQDQVGTITYGGETFRRAYVDEDVYEAARCFTGWTVSTGRWPQRGTPSTGAFLLLDSWHDTNPKTVLNASPDRTPNFPRNQSAEKDGQGVYTLLARHPGTARHICTKLVRRFIADTPPASVVNAAVEKWMATRDAPDQIKQVLQVILASNEFRTTWGQKIKRPFDYVVAYLRATEANLPSDVDDIGGDRTKGSYWANIMWNMGQTGHRLFEWPTPTGHPDLASYWGNSNSMLRRWNLLAFLGSNSEWDANAGIDLMAKTDMSKPCPQIVDAWIDRLCGYQITPEVRQGLIDFLAMTVNGGDPTKPPAATKNESASDPNTLAERLTGMVYLLAMSPDWQRR